ncbi:MAG: hypothetical protein AAGI30_08055 [Planctomycetota bacterium]
MLWVALRVIKGLTAIGVIREYTITMRAIDSLDELSEPEANAVHELDDLECRSRDASPGVA